MALNQLTVLCNRIWKKSVVVHSKEIIPTIQVFWDMTPLNLDVDTDVLGNCFYLEISIQIML